jgi:hypothetical protein
MNEERARDHSWAISPNYTEYVLSDIALWPARHLNLLGTRATWQRPFAIPQQVKRICSPHWLAINASSLKPSPLSSASSAMINSIYPPRFTSGEMAEWLKAHAWKACLPQGNVGSNPTLSAR